MKTKLALLLLFATPLLAKEHVWEHGKIVSQESVSSDGGIVTIPVYGMLVTRQVTRQTNQVILEYNGYIITLVEKPSKHFLLFPEGINCVFYKDNEWYVFLDTHKREHKFSAIHIVKKKDAA